MKLSKYVEGLQKLEKEHGDLEVVYSADDEGNDFHKVSWVGELFYFEDLDSYYLERVDEDELDEYENPVKAICIN